MSLSPRVLLSIDYEPVFALFRHYDRLTDIEQRRTLDHGFTREAIDPILEQLGSARASIYLVGEIANWYPEVPHKIVAAGHELGLHCHIHRPLLNVRELAEDLRASTAWCRQYGVRGYRAPMVGISEGAYQLLGESGFSYSSSIYAPAGTLLRKGSVWEIPVSTLRLRGKNGTYTAPRDFSFPLLLSGEFPYGSSFSIGLMGTRLFPILEQELKRAFAGPGATLLAADAVCHGEEITHVGAADAAGEDMVLVLGAHSSAVAEGVEIERESGHQQASVTEPLVSRDPF